MNGDYDHLRADGVSVVVDCAGSRLSRVLHRDADLGDLPDADRAGPAGAADAPTRHQPRRGAGAPGRAGRALGGLARHAGVGSARRRRRLLRRRPAGGERQPAHAVQAHPSPVLSLGGGKVLLAGEVRLAVRRRCAEPWLYGSEMVDLDETFGRFHRCLRARSRQTRTPGP
jgi:hypothetical protein